MGSTSGDISKLVDSILRLREEMNVPREECSEREDSYTLSSCNHNLDMEAKEEVEIAFTNTTCYHCNGYYGPSFGDTLCATCHLFLYPISQRTIIPTYIPEQDSDSDSGNDEPIDPALFRINGFDHSDDSMQGPLMARFERSLNGPERSRYSTRASYNYPRVALPGCSSSSITSTHDGPSVKVDILLSVQLQRLSTPSPHPFDNFNIDLLPPEVLIHTFQYLDELSLWSIGQVCSRLRAILFMYVKVEKWKDLTQRRWPLLDLKSSDQDWYELYTAMIRSSCCFKCVHQMAAQSLPSNCDQNNSWRAHRLRTELRAIRTDPLDGIEAIPLDTDCFHWQATLEGPSGSSYEGGIFFLYIQVPVSYPLKPPQVRFMTKIFHPNISRHGDIGIDSLNQNWSLALTMSKLLISIQSLLTDPFCDVGMEPDICKLYVTNRKAFEEQARKWTAKYAMHDLIPH